MKTLEDQIREIVKDEMRNLDADGYQLEIDSLRNQVLLLRDKLERARGVLAVAATNSGIWDASSLTAQECRQAINKAFQILI